ERTNRRTSVRLLGEVVHDLDAGEIALVHRAVVRLAGERLLMDASRRVAVEEASVTRLELQHAPGRLGHEAPDHLLIVDPPTAVQRVHEMRFERVGWGHHRVVAALPHTGAARATEKALDDDDDRQRGRRVGGVRRGGEAGAARPEDQDVSLDDVDHRAMRASKNARPSGAVHSPVPIARATSRPSRPITNTTGEYATPNAPLTAPDMSSSTSIVSLWSRTQARTVSRDSSMFTASTTRPRGPNSR